MAQLKASFQVDFDLLNLNWFEANFESHFLVTGQPTTWPDAYTIFTENEALVLYGSGFGYDGAANMNMGTAELIEGWFYDPNLLAYLQVFRLANIAVSAQELHDAIQSAATGDDFALLETILSGKDMMYLSPDNDNVRGFGGADRIFGYEGDDRLVGDAGDDSLFGGDDNDVLIGNTGSDRLFGGDDDDKLFGGNGHDKLFGGEDDDLLVGGYGRDQLDGGEDNDILRGGHGNDRLDGGAGMDILRGGNGQDVLRGGAGNDKLFGGAGVDLFVFMTGDGKDFVRDFNAHFLSHDRIDLSGLASVSNWQDLKNNHMSQVGDDVVIDGGNGDVMILRKTDIGELYKDYFVF